jgi:hypothetical protein
MVMRNCEFIDIWVGRWWVYDEDFYESFGGRCHVYDGFLDKMMREGTRQWKEIHIYYELKKYHVKMYNNTIES